MRCSRKKEQREWGKEVRSNKLFTFFFFSTVLCNVLLSLLPSVACWFCDPMCWLALQVRGNIHCLKKKKKQRRENEDLKSQILPWEDEVSQLWEILCFKRAQHWKRTTKLNEKQHSSRHTVYGVAVDGFLEFFVSLSLRFDTLYCALRLMYMDDDVDGGEREKKMWTKENEREENRWGWKKLEKNEITTNDRVLNEQQKKRRKKKVIVRRIWN